MKNIERIVVMGGSFNPPTIAHQELMKDAMKAVDAELGFFVPVSDAYFLHIILFEYFNIHV